MVKVIEGYVLNQAIGQGNFGLVYRATHKQKSGIFAVKVIPIQKFQQNQKLQIYTNNQIEALQAIGISEYIIRFYQMIKSKNNCYLIYEYCNGGTLLNLLKKQQKLQEKRALLIFKQLLEAFKVLNKNSIMHRDLKPQNIFFTSVNQSHQEGQQNQNDKKKVKLGDFGFCKGLKPDQNLAKTMLGSPIYMAPQVLKGQTYNMKADIWSLGVILFQMLYGYCPFQSKSIASLINTIDTQPVQLPTKIAVSQKTQNLIKRLLTKDYFRRIGWVELFGIKIDQNGQYIDQPPPVLSSSQDRGSTPNKKVFSSLLGSLSLGNNSLMPNNRSYSLIRDQQNKKIKNQAKTQIKYAINKKSIQETVPGPTITPNIGNPSNQSQIRGNSQPKQPKKFYSQNYISVLTTPLSLKRIQNDGDSKSNQKIKVPGSYDRAQKKSETQKILLPPPVLQISSPITFRQERLTSMDNIDLIKQQSFQLNIPVANNIEPTPFNKYRENIGMGSNLSSRFLSDRIIKDTQRHSNSHFIPSNTNSNPQVLQIDAKRSFLLKIHQGVTKYLAKAISILQQKFALYKTSKLASDFNILKDLLQDCYIILKISQQKLKSITQSIKITQTSLLDMATIINYEHIQVEKFVNQLRNQLQRFSIDLPNIPTNTQLIKTDRIQNANNFKQLIKNKFMVQAIDDGF